MALMLTACSPARVIAWQPGDLVFLDLDCGELCDAIEDVTLKQYGVEGPRLSPVGIVVQGQTDWEVLEAWDGVQRTPLATFLGRVPDTHWRASRLKQSWQGQVPAAIAFAEKQLGAPYDEAFLVNNGAYYCSELVVDAFASPGPAAPFENRPMYYATETALPAGETWRAYFEKRKEPVPEKAPGQSPLGIYLSPALERLR